MGEELAQTFAHNRVVIHDHHADNVAHAQPLILSVGTCTRMLVSMPWLSTTVGVMKYWELSVGYNGTPEPLPGDDAERTTRPGCERA